MAERPRFPRTPRPPLPEAAPEPAEAVETKAATDPFEEIDFGSFFDDYLDPGYKSPSSEQVEKPSFETFLSAPVTLGDYLRSQLSMVPLADHIRDRCGFDHRQPRRKRLRDATLDEIAASGEHKPEDLEAALKEVQKLDPAGVAPATFASACCCNSRAVMAGKAWLGRSSQTT